MAKEKVDLREIPVEKLTRGKYQPRRHFDETALEELAQSIKSTGLLQPIVVRPISKEGFEIIAGERRWRALQIAGLDSATCLVKHFTDDQAAEASAIENVNRVDLNPIEEAKAYQRLIDDFGYVHEEIAIAIGKSRAKITNALRLLKLTNLVQDYLVCGKLSEGHGKILAGLSSASDQVMLAKKIVSRGWSVRKLEQEVKKLGSEQVRTNSLDPNLKALEISLSDHIGCPVKIDYEEQRGQVKIDFKNLDILEGIFRKLGYTKEV